MANTYRVLSIDGGGMRGVYSAAYLNSLASHYSKKRSIDSIDLGKAFDLITGTSTGAILACALANKTPMAEVIKLYREHGPKIFPEKVPSNICRLLLQAPKRSRLNKQGAIALEKALSDALGDTKVIDIWKQRGIALAVPSVEMSNHRAWVFKTPHLANSKDRDGNYTLIDVCLATSAAPIFRSIAAIKNPDGEGKFAFVDGGLWANNPVLVGLIDALEMTKEGDQIEIYCMGTFPPPSGDQISQSNAHWGYAKWKFGANVPNVSITAQQYAYDNMARMLAKHVNRDVKIIRFPKGEAPPSLMNYLDLDETSSDGMDALIRQGETDSYLTFSKSGDGVDVDGKKIEDLMMLAPEDTENV